MQNTRVVGVLVLLSVAWAMPAAGEDGPRRRAKPPRWPEDVLDVFFDDSREQLVGARPVKTQAGVDALDTALPGNEASWSLLIDAESLELEIKRVVNGLSGAVSKRGQFNSGGYRLCRRDYSLLAVLFRVVEEFDERVRWQRDAGVVRQHLLRAANVCETASDVSYSEAKQTQALLIDLMRGQSPPDDAAFDPALEKGLVDRPQLMKRMEVAVEEIISPSLSSTKVFRRRSSDIAHESQLLAVLAKVISEEGYEYSDDEDFSKYARQLGEVSAALFRASKEKNYAESRSAADRLRQSCADCHEEFKF